MSDKWHVWYSTRGKLRGISIIHRCSDHGFRMEPDGLSEADRIEYCQEICDKLNQYELLKKSKVLP